MTMSVVVFILSSINWLIDWLIDWWCFSLYMVDWKEPWKDAVADTDLSVGRTEMLPLFFCVRFVHHLFSSSGLQSFDLFHAGRNLVDTKHGENTVQSSSKHRNDTSLTFSFSIKFINCSVYFFLLNCYIVHFTMANKIWWIFLSRLLAVAPTSLSQQSFMRRTVINVTFISLDDKKSEAVGGAGVDDAEFFLW